MSEELKRHFRQPGRGPGSRARRGLACGALLACIAGGGAAGCGRPAPDPPAVRLVDVFARQGGTAARPPAHRAPLATEWRFASTTGPGPGAANATLGWQAGPGVADLALRRGCLAGRTTTDFPVLHLAHSFPEKPDDQLYSIEIRLRASAGANLAVQLTRADLLDLDQAVAAGRAFPWRLTTPLVAGAAEHTYVLSAAASPFPIRASSVRHVLVRPTDTAGATFEIASIRLIFQRDMLASIPSGVRWQGLSEIYRESLVEHAGESIRLPLDVPRDAWLDLAVGTLADGPVRFRLEAREGNREPCTLLDRSVRKADRWEEAPVDLAGYGGRQVDLVLRLEAAEPGSVGVWGAPVVRRRFAGGDGPARRPRGAILIFADTLRRDHLETYGYGRSTAPTVARLARGGAVFRDCQAEATWTKVAAPSILTSLYPPSHGVKDFEDRLPTSAVTLAGAFRDAGFATLSLSSVIFTGRFSNLHLGFEELHESGSLANRASSKTAGELVDRLIPWLEEHRQVPFFVLLHVTDPHDPYEPAPPYDRLWVDPARKAEHERQRERVRPHIADALLQAYAMPSRDEVAAAGVDPDAYIAVERDLYDGAIRGMDDALGRLDVALHRLGLADDVLVTLVADHGEEFFDHGHMFHGQTVYGELTEVPLIFWGAGVKPGKVVEETVQTIDVMPTLLALCGVAVPGQAQGRSLAALVSGAAAGHPGARPAFSIKAATRDVFGPAPRGTESMSVLTGGWKLIHNVARPPGRPEYELYDHRRDRLDRLDLAAGHGDVVHRLARLLAEWRSKVESQRLPADAAAARSLSSAELERLRSLGYIR
jgi:arylsulfatase A-like enzyme